MCEQNKFALMRSRCALMLEEFTSLSIRSRLDCYFAFILITHSLLPASQKCEKDIESMTENHNKCELDTKKLHDNFQGARRKAEQFIKT